MAVKILRTKVSSHEDIANKVHKIRIIFSEGEGLEFQAGQFVNILVAPATRRSYSIASSPADLAGIDLIGDSVIGGPGSIFFANAKQGDDIEILGPLGNFVYKESQNPACFFATGTGVVPFISMISYALETVQTKRQIILFLGFRHEEDIFYREFFENLASQYTNFKFVMTLSKPSNDWSGLQGRITDHYIEYAKENQNFEGYVCGSRTMISEVVENLTNLGVPKENIYYEQYY